MNFRAIALKEWQQFQNVDIDFDERLTILTGANGSGKTTILNILARHAGWEHESLGTPKLEKMTGLVKFLYRLFNGEDKSEDRVIGSITYDNNVKTKLTVPESKSLRYTINIENQEKVKCFLIPSHGSVYFYQPLENFPVKKKDVTAAFDEVSKTIKGRYRGGGGYSSSYFMKNTLIGWAIQGFGVQDGVKTIMTRDQELVDYYEGFQSVLRQILPKSLGFQEFEIRSGEIVFVCNGGEDEFIFETASGGISALIDVAWQIYMYSTKEHDDFTVLIDEIENHLHPTMQRHVLPDLMAAFPRARFIVASHNPLVVSSVKDSKVYVLKYNEKGKVESEKLDFEKRPKTATEILDEVLGVSFTMPVWVEDKLRSIVESYVHKAMDRNDFEQMRKDLAEVGLERLMPYAIKDVMGGRND